MRSTARRMLGLLCLGSALSLSLMGCPGDEADSELPAIPSEEEEAAKAAQSITDENATAEFERLKKEIEGGH